MAAGMNVARLNFSHGSHEHHAKTVAHLREAAGRHGERIGAPYPLAIALDTKGPEIRTGVLAGERPGGSGGPAEVPLKKGATVRLSTDGQFENGCTERLVYVDYANVVGAVKRGSSVYLDDGLISLTVSEVGERTRSTG